MAVLCKSFLLSAVLSHLFALSQGFLFNKPCKNWCIFRGRPVCGTDGKTYRSLCHLKNERCNNDNLRLLSYGRCKTCIQNCSRWPFRPICGTNGISYKNSCYLQNAQCRNKEKNKPIKIAHNGRCKSCTARCGSVPYSPVCGTNGVTYRSSCTFLNAQCRVRGLQLAHRGRCWQA